jgi:hypothetical protein
MIYVFSCIEHPAECVVVRCHHSERDSINPGVCPQCGQTFEQDLRGHGGFSFKRTPGVRSGVYALDYGRRATEDLTVPGKMEMLKKEGRIKDPFDSGPAPITNMDKVDL